MLWMSSGLLGSLANPSLGSLIILLSSAFMSCIEELNNLVFIGWSQLAFKTINNYLIALSVNLIC
jgi:hypothetical protein